MFVQTKLSCNHMSFTTIVQLYYEKFPQKCDAFIPRDIFSKSLMVFPILVFNFGFVFVFIL